MASLESGSCGGEWTSCLALPARLAKHTELRCEEKVSKVSKMVAASWKNRREVGAEARAGGRRSLE